MKSIYEFLLTFDFLSPGPQINHKGNSRYSNFVGLLFTLGIIAITIYTLIDDIKKFVTKTDPDIVISKTYSDDNTFNLTNKSLKFYLTFKKIDILSQTFTEIYYSEIKEIMGWDDDKLTNSGPMVTISLVNTDGYKVFDLPYQYGNITGKAQFIPMVNCNESFFDDYNTHQDYGMTPFSKQEIIEVQKSAFCLPDFIYASLKTEMDSKTILTITIDATFVNKLKTNGNINHLFANLYYPQVVVNTNPAYYYNNSHYRGVWQETNYYIDITYIRANLVKIQKSTIKRNMKNFVFQNKDEYDIFTIQQLDIRRRG